MATGDFSKLVVLVTRALERAKVKAIENGVVRRNGEEPDGMLWPWELSEGLRLCGFSPSEVVIPAKGSIRQVTVMDQVVAKLEEAGVLHTYIREGQKKRYYAGPKTVSAKNSALWAD